MNSRRLFACALALSCVLPAAAAPLFDRVQGSLSASASDVRGMATVQVSRATLQDAKAGSEITVAIPNIGSYRYRVVQRVEDGDVVRLDAVLIGRPSHRLTLGVREQGVSGFMATPEGSFSLGYVNGRQWLGAVGKQHDWPTLDDAGRPLVFADRAAKPSEQAPVKGAQPIGLNLAQLTSMQEGDEASLRLADAGPLRVSYDQTRANQDSATWVGHLTDYGKDFRVLLTYSPAGTIGHILTPQGEYEIVSSKSGDAYLVDPRKLGMQRVEGDEACIPAAPPRSDARNDKAAASAAGADASSANRLSRDGPGARGPQANATATTTPSATTISAAALPNSTVVDVLVLYTPGFAADKGGVAGAQAAIDHLLALSNQAYVDSGVPLVLRKVAADQVNVSDKTTNSSLLSDLTNAIGAFSGIKTRRNALGADLVSIVRPFWKQYQAGCGVGWIGGYNGSPISQASGYAYSAVSEGSDRAGSGWYCDVNSFAHELGHNMGLMHDRATVTQQGGGQGATSYAYGYGLSGSFGTIMSYLWPKLGKFSNPRDYTCGGSSRCGIPDTEASSADNSKALDYTRTGVSAFRTTATTTTQQLTISGTVTVNGAAQGGVTISGASCTTTGSNGVYQCNVSTGFSGVLTPLHAVNGYWTTFTPSSRTYSNLTSSAVNQNFLGRR
ncbi:MAG TPA: M12 family metallo-peptidase [Burkholderiales bacterium]|nr:M12 family metallo-peptidase [Burkholderiales bacterium]